MSCVSGPDRLLRSHPSLIFFGQTMLSLYWILFHHFVTLLHLLTRPTLITPSPFDSFDWWSISMGKIISYTKIELHFRHVFEGPNFNRRCHCTSACPPFSIWMTFATSVDSYHYNIEVLPATGNYNGWTTQTGEPSWCNTTRWFWKCRLQGVVLIKLSTWSCLEIRMQDEITVWGLIIIPSRGWKSLNIWEQL